MDQGSIKEYISYDKVNGLSARIKYFKKGDNTAAAPGNRGYVIVGLPRKYYYARRRLRVYAYGGGSLPGTTRKTGTKK